MNNEDQNSGKERPGNGKMLFAMVSIGVLCALLIVLTYENTRTVIQKNKTEALQKAIFKVIPNSRSFKTFHMDQQGKLQPVNGDATNEKKIYAGYDEKGVFKGIAIEASGQGYADIIRVLYGYDPELQKVVGFYVLESKETPGLGDKIEKDDQFLENFNALDVSLTSDESGLIHQVVTVKNNTKANPWEIDAITGATISSRAIGDLMSTSTNYWIPVLYRNRALFAGSESQKLKKVP